jgi:hypoxanthine-guanine phosphoribosyltransferase
MNGLPTGAAVFEDDIESVLLTEEQVQGKVRDLAAQISKDSCRASRWWRPPPGPG